MTLMPLSVPLHVYTWLSVRISSASVMPGPLQATYTGPQLRAAATMYAIMVEGLFGPANWEAVKARARMDIARRTVQAGLASD